MPYVGKKPADIIATAVDTTTGTFSGVVDADAGITVDNITIDGTEIDLSSGDLTVDVAGDIILSAAGGEIRFDDGSQQEFVIDMNDASTKTVLRTLVSDADLTFEGNDGGSGFTALTLDMSDAGTAIFNHDIKIADNNNIQLGAGVDLMLSSDGTNGTIENQQSNGDIIFKGNDGGSTIEAARFDMSGAGSLLVGKANTTAGVTGIELETSGTIVSTRDGNTNIFLNRTSSAGNLIEFRKDNTAVGTISTDFDTIAITGNAATASHTSGLAFASSSSAQRIVPCQQGTSIVDDTINLGGSGQRFDDIHASNGTIQTSDRNEKQDIEELNDAEKRVAVVAKGLMRKFRWKSKVEIKGDKARTHFGIIAQDLEDAFKAEGLDATKYAMFCSDTWWEKEITVDAVEADEEKGIEAKNAYTRRDVKEEATEGYTEKTRLGVRYSELLAFIISAI